MAGQVSDQPVLFALHANDRLPLYTVPFKAPTLMVDAFHQQHQSNGQHPTIRWEGIGKTNVFSIGGTQWKAQCRKESQPSDVLMVPRWFPRGSSTDTRPRAVTALGRVGSKMHVERDGNAVRGHTSKTLHPPTRKPTPPPMMLFGGARGGVPPRTTTPTPAGASLVISGPPRTTTPPPTFVRASTPPPAAVSVARVVGPPAPALITKDPVVQVKAPVKPFEVTQGMRDAVHANNLRKAVKSFVQRVMDGEGQKMPPHEQLRTALVDIAVFRNPGRYHLQDDVARGLQREATANNTNTSAAAQQPTQNTTVHKPSPTDKRKASSPTDKPAKKKKSQSATTKSQETKKGKKRATPDIPTVDTTAPPDKAPRFTSTARPTHGMGKHAAVAAAMRAQHRTHSASSGDVSLSSSEEESEGHMQRDTKMNPGAYKDGRVAAKKHASPTNNDAGPQQHGDAGDAVPQAKRQRLAELSDDDDDDDLPKAPRAAAPAPTTHAPTNQRLPMRGVSEPPALRTHSESPEERPVPPKGAPRGTPSPPKVVLPAVVLELAHTFDKELPRGVRAVLEGNGMLKPQNGGAVDRVESPQQFQALHKEYEQLYPAYTELQQRVHALKHALQVLRQAADASKSDAERLALLQEYARVWEARGDQAHTWQRMLSHLHVRLGGVRAAMAAYAQAHLGK